MRQSDFPYIKNFIIKISYTVRREVWTETILYWYLKYHPKPSSVQSVRKLKIVWASLLCPCQQMLAELYCPSVSLSRPSVLQILKLCHLSAFPKSIYRLLRSSTVSTSSLSSNIGFVQFKHLSVNLKVFLSINSTFEPRHEISNNVVCATSKASDQPAHTRSLIRAFASRLNTLWVLSYWRVSKLKRRPHRLVWVYTCQNATLLEITCHGLLVSTSSLSPNMGFVQFKHLSVNWNIFLSISFNIDFGCS